MVSRSALEPSMTKRCRRFGSTPRSTRSSKSGGCRGIFTRPSYHSKACLFPWASTPRHRAHDVRQQSGRVNDQQFHLQGSTGPPVAPVPEILVDKLVADAGFADPQLSAISVSPGGSCRWRHDASRSLNGGNPGRCSWPRRPVSLPPSLPRPWRRNRGLLTRNWRSERRPYRPGVSHQPPLPPTTARPLQCWPPPQDVDEFIYGHARGLDQFH
jgi:hypothetical protein